MITVQLNTCKHTFFRMNKILCDFRMSDKRLKEKLAELDADLLSEGDSEKEANTREELAEVQKQLN